MALLVALVAFCVVLASAAKQIELLYELTEERPSGTFVGDVAGDARLRHRYSDANFRLLRFRFLSDSTVTPAFRIDPTTGVIQTSGRVDRDVMCAGVVLCRVKLDVAVQPVLLFMIVKVSVDIQDINDNQPVFPEPAVSHQLLESALPGIGFALPSASDRDGPAFGVQHYELLALTSTFELRLTPKVDGSTAVRLVLSRRLDRETQALYQVAVIASDGGEPALTARLDVSVRILDANDNQPVFGNTSYEAIIAENSPVGLLVATVRAVDADTGANARVTYFFSPRTALTHGGVFKIDPQTGAVTISGVVDYEHSVVRHLVVIARDSGPDAVGVETTVVVRVTDMNDNAPEVRVSTLGQGGSATVAEDAPVGTFVAHIAVSDADSGRSGTVTCSLDLTDHFSLRTLPAGEEFQVSTAAGMDRETTPRHSLRLRCRDDGDPSLETVKRIAVIITDINDHTPVFSRNSYTVTIPENNPVGAVIIQLNVTDRDSGLNANVRFSLLQSNASELFRVGALDGRVTAARSFDREKLARITLVVVATDGGVTARSSSTTVILTISDVNDHTPTFTKPGYSFGVYENKPARSAVGAVLATDADSALYNKVRYSLASDSTAHFEMDAATGQLVTTRRLDREAVAVYHLVATATDGEGESALTASVSITVYVADQNDNAPVFAFPSPHNSTVSVPGGAPAGYIVTRVLATDADIDVNARLAYRLIDGDEDVFAVDSRRGEVSLLADLSDITLKRFELTVMASDSSYPQRNARAQLTILVNDSLPLDGASPNQSSLLAGHNLVIVIVIASVTFAVAVGLLLAILLLRRQDASRRDHKYNCRMEALKMLTSRESAVSDMSPPNRCLASAELSTKTKKEVSFSMDVEDTGVPHNKSAQSWPSTIDPHNMQFPQASSSVLTAHGSTFSPVLDTGGSTYRPLVKVGESHQLKSPQLEVHQLLEMLRHDAETDSAYSGDGSNTDSGRGGSDEGEGHHPSHRPTEHPSHHPTQHPTVHKVPSTNQKRHLLSDDDSFHGNQVVPELWASPRHAYPAKPLSFETFSPRGHQQSAAPRHVDTPHRVLLTQDDTALTTDTGTAMYSCADVSDILHTPSHFQPTEDDDDTTTTSGSYVVDAHELCREIDDIFFRDLIV